MRIRSEWVLTCSTDTIFCRIFLIEDNSILFESTSVFFVFIVFLLRCIEPTSTIVFFFNSNACLKCRKQFTFINLFVFIFWMNEHKRNVLNSKCSVKRLFLLIFYISFRKYVLYFVDKYISWCIQWSRDNENRSSTGIYLIPTNILEFNKIVYA